MPSERELFLRDPANPIDGDTRFEATTNGTCIVIHPSVEVGCIKVPKEAENIFLMKNSYAIFQYREGNYELHLKP